MSGDERFGLRAPDHPSRIERNKAAKGAVSLYVLECPPQGAKT